jgi:hypothetical protein
MVYVEISLLHVRFFLMGLFYEVASHGFVFHCVIFVSRYYVVGTSNGM